MKRLAIPALIASLFAGSAYAQSNLIISSTTYQDVGAVASLAVGNLLPGGGNAIANGQFPSVFTNTTPDAAFGVTSAMSLLQYDTGSSSFAGTVNIDTSQIVTSFSSKSEMALNVSADGQSVSFMGYSAPVGALDVSNSNTAGAFDPTNPVAQTYARVVGSVNLSSGALSTIQTNAYSGNNGRAAYLSSDGNYYMVGNAGNSGTFTSQAQAVTINSMLSANTGVQVVSATGASSQTGGAYNSSVIGQYSGAAVGTTTTKTKSGVTTTTYSSTGGQYGFDIASVNGNVADKTGKDNNFRGMTVYNGTMYVTKGSGSNGINSVYQVGATGALLNGGSLPSNAAITILPGMPTTLASATTATNPFGLFFGDANNLFVADEGNGKYTAGKASDTAAGLGWYQLVNNTWTLKQTFQSGLAGQVTAASGLSWTVQQDGLRNITGRKNADGSYDIYANTSTVSNDAAHDLGADPNEVVHIKINASSTAVNDSFDVVATAAVGQRFGGVALSAVTVPVPEPETFAMLLAGLGLIGAAVRRRQK